MIEVYVQLIIHKRRIFSSVPKRLQEEVKNRLLELGYDVDGNEIDE